MRRRNSEAGVGLRRIPVYRGVAKKEGKTVTRSQPAEFVAEGGTGSVSERTGRKRSLRLRGSETQTEEREPDLGRRNEDYRGWEQREGRRGRQRCDAVRRAGG